MFKSTRLGILTTILFCFSQTLEVHANFRRGSFPEGIFIMMVSQEKKPLVSAKNKGFSNISGQIPTGKEGDIIGPTVKDALFTVYFFSSESLSLRLLEPLEGGL